jgi:hypothetical protein
MIITNAKQIAELKDKWIEECYTACIPPNVPTKKRNKWIKKHCIVTIKPGTQMLVFICDKILIGTFEFDGKTIEVYVGEKQLQ